MRERIPHSLSGHVLNVELLGDPGMLHRAKYSRFRNESLASFEEDAQSGPLHLKGSPSSHSPTPNMPVDSVAIGTPDSPVALCALIPRMGNLKLANPSTLPSLKNFCLRTKEVPRIKLTECATVPSGPTSPEINLTACLSSSYPRGNLDKPLKGSPNVQKENLLLGTEESALLTKPVKDLGRKGGETGLESGLSYSIRYMGCIEVLQSMRSLDFGTRTQVTREAISRLCEAVPGTHGAIKKRKPPAKFLSPVLGKSNLQFSGINIKLTISTSSLTLMNSETQQIIANHHMQSISFASGGDPDTTDYVAYVAKDPVNQRACHILECPSGVAQEVINTIGQAFELRFKQYLKNPSTLIASNESEVVNPGGSTWNIQDKEDHEYYNEISGNEPPAGGLLDIRLKVPTDANCPTHCEQQYSSTMSPKSTNIYENCTEGFKAVDIGGEQRQVANKDAPSLLKNASKVDLFDDPRYINTQNLPATPCATRNLTSVPTCGSPLHYSKSLEALEQNLSCNMAAVGGVVGIKQQLWNEECYHGMLTRKAAESLLVNDGDFLVRESATSPGQYVLSGLQRGQPKHLLLVDPEGKVRTKDHTFDSVGHLIRYHMENKLPIISSGSELNLNQPVRKGTGYSEYN
ncbi:PREDICTED: SHC-transforming protein 4 [Gekko japonicus]|uniref:SHC-transforming protein 4 n=1 Tax=Gekko japonicus TaxID=146911 RepID=A0ABM1LBR7_GEKJA|nr:PREDICTED: SHC-transforming protein 4 [Gekko japonicus]